MSRIGAARPSRPSVAEDALHECGPGAAPGALVEAVGTGRGSSRSRDRAGARTIAAGRRTEDRVQLVVVERGEGRTERADERAVRRVRPGRGAAAQDRHRARRARPTRRDRLVEEAGRRRSRPCRSRSMRPARPAAASSSTAASRANASSRPTNRALVYLAGMAAILGRHGVERTIGARPRSATLAR